MQTHAYVHTLIHSTHFGCVSMLFMLLLEIVNSISAGLMFVLAYGGLLKAQLSICQIAGSPNLLRNFALVGPFLHKDIEIIVKN